MYFIWFTKCNFVTTHSSVITWSNNYAHKLIKSFVIGQCDLKLQNQERAWVLQKVPKSIQERKPLVIPANKEGENKSEFRGRLLRGRVSYRRSFGAFRSLPFARFLYSRFYSWEIGVQNYCGSNFDIEYYDYK